MCKYKRNYPNHFLKTQLLLIFRRAYVCSCGHVSDGLWGIEYMQFAYTENTMALSVSRRRTMPYSLCICVALPKLEILLSLKAAAGEAVIVVS